MPGSFDPYHKWLAIPPEDQPPDHYRLLAVPRFEEDPDVIAAAADRQMAHLRTYQSGPHAPLSQRLLNEVAAARICLLNPDKKAAYDRQLRRQLEPKAAARKPPVVARAPSPARAAASDQETAEWTGLRELGEYKLLEKLGAGGMGEVYKAVHTEMDRVVAVKVLPPGHLQDERAVARFKREIKAVAQLNHPNVVQAHDAREIEGTRFLVMEYVEGMDLRDVAKRTGPLPVADACELIRQAALGLQCAHEHGLVHRDIKPSNLMLSVSHQPSAFSGQQANLDPLAPRPPSLAPLVKVLDLGLARAQIEQGEEEEVTGTGEAMGTADYIAPEQAADSRSVDIRADLYSLGCTLYRLIAGQPPFSGPKYNTAVKKLMGHIQDPVPPITKFRPDVPKRLEIILGRLLAKDPAKRLATPAEVAEALVPLSLGHDLSGLYARALGKIPVPPPPRQAEVRTHSVQSSGLTRFFQRFKGAEPEAPGAAAAGVGRSHSKFPAYAGYAAVAAVVLLIVVAWGVMTASRSSQEGPAGQASSLPAGRDARPAPRPKTQHLVLHWPAADRGDAKLEIDRWPRNIADLADPKNPDVLKMEVKPGPHKVWIARRGFEPFEQTVTVERGKDVVVRPEWAKPPDVAKVPVPKPKPEKPKPKDVAEKPPKPEPKPPEIDPALKRRQELDAKYAQALEPVEALVAAWDFRGAVAALAKIEFEEPDLMARRNARGRELQRLVALKARIIARINAARPPIRKSALMIKGMNGDVVKAAESGITTKLAGGKTESFAWNELGTKAPQRLVTLVIDRQKPDDWLAAGLLALACGDAASAEKHFGQARTLGTDIGPYLAPLAAAAFAEAKALLEKKEFTKAEAALAALEQNYGQIPWFLSNKRAFAAARAEAKAGIARLGELEAEKLYTEAVELFNERELFDLKPLVERLKADYPNTPAVRESERAPSFFEMQQAVANLGKFISVRQDGKGDFTTIQAAINAAPHSSLIEIQDSGPYSEKITIGEHKATLTLRGKKGCWPIITSWGSRKVANPLVVIDASGTNLERLVVAHGAPRNTDDPFIVHVRRGDLRLRRTMMFSKGGSAIRTLGSHPLAQCEVEDCLIVGDGELRGALSFTNSLLIEGHLVVGTVQQRELRACTILSTLTCTYPSTLILDCIVASLPGNPASQRIENCDMFGTGGPPAQAKDSFRADPQFRDPKNLDYRLMPTSPCIGKASDGGDIGCRYTPEMIEMCKKALELRAKGIIKF